MGLGGLLSLNIHSIKRGLCEWILNRFDPNTYTLNVHNNSMVFTPVDVEWILGLKFGGDELDTNGSPSLITDLQQSLFENKKELSLSEIKYKLLKLKDDSK